MKVGLFFGSFNPIHIGHLIIAETMVSKTDLDRVWFVVSPQNPFKKKKNLLNEYDRLHLVELALEENESLQPCSDEFSLPKPSYTVNTLAHLSDKYNHDFSLIMGSDNLLSLPKWKNSEVITENYSIYVYERPGSMAVDSALSFQKIEAPLMHISSSYIREAIKNGESIRYMVHPAVHNYIKEMNLYKSM